jgi:hypothetical protein
VNETTTIETTGPVQITIQIEELESALEDAADAARAGEPTAKIVDGLVRRTIKRNAEQTARTRTLEEIKGIVYDHLRAAGKQFDHGPVHREAVSGVPDIQKEIEIYGSGLLGRSGDYDEYFAAVVCEAFAEA